MTTPCNQFPFEVRLRTREGDILVTRFTSDMARLGEEPSSPAAGIRENQDIDILFRAPSDFRFTMDGLDVVSLPGMDRQGDTCFLHPSDWYRPLFEGKNFPLVPGYYVMTVTGRGRAWHSVVEILPRYLQKQQWQDMRDELTGEIRRISFDFMRRTMHLDLPLDENSGVGSEMLLRFYVINDMAPQVLRVVQDLARTANSRIVLQRACVPQGLLLREDRHSRPATDRPGRSSPYTYALRMETTWDIAENRFAKAVLIGLEKSLASFVSGIRENEERLRREQEELKRYRKDYQYQMRQDGLDQFGRYRKRAQQILNAIRLASRAPWFEAAQAGEGPVWDLTALRDPRYAVLFRLQRHLRNPEESLSVSSFYRFQWKRTDKLYELWCFLSFMKALGARGWHMEEGPAVTASGGRYILESLEPGTVIVMKRGREEIHAVYDAVIPCTAADTDKDHHPLYTNNPHRRPDMRIDYYKDAAYYGSLVADFKYRDIYRLWNDGNSGSDIRIQFNAYRDMNTKFYRHMDEKESLRNSRPVKEVWAVFPRETPARSDEDYSLRFISLAPGLAAEEKLPALLDRYFENLAE